MKKEKNKVIFDVDAQLDAAFGKEGTPERAAAEERANAFFIGQIIEDARKKANITQEELAARIGKTSRTFHALRQVAPNPRCQPSTASSPLLVLRLNSHQRYD